MNRKKSLFIFLAILAICTAWYFGNELSQKKVPPSQVTAYGNVDVRQVDIGFRVAGLLKTVNFEEGNWVKPGMCLASLDPKPYDSQLKEAQAAAAAAQATLENAKILLERRKELIPIGGVSQEDLDDALSNFTLAEANLNQALATVAVAKDQLDFTQAFAPSEGMIITRIREPGTVLRAGDPVYTLTIISPVWVQAYVTEPELGLIKYGMKAEIFTDTPQHSPYEGIVGFISPVAEFTPKMVQTTDLRPDLVYRIRIRVDNFDQGLKQGMPVTVIFRVKP